MRIMHPIVRAGQIAVTGEIHPRRWELLARSVEQVPASHVCDLGCGDGPLLDYLSVDRYTGIDSDVASIERARRRWPETRARFFVGELLDFDLTTLDAVDCVILSSVTHHLDDEAVIELLRKVLRDARPSTLFIQDAEPRGPLGPLVTTLDRGDFLRTEQQLRRLVETVIPVEPMWSYLNPLRSFRQFLFRGLTATTPLTS